MDDYQKQVCTYYERNIIGTVDQHEHAFVPDFNFASKGEEGKLKEKQYKLFRAFISSQNIRNNRSSITEDETTDGETHNVRSAAHYNGLNNLNNFTIQDSEERAGSLETVDSMGNDVDVVFLKHAQMMENAGKEFEIGPTPFSTMYYNDPQYVNKFPEICEEKSIVRNLNNQVNPRLAHNGSQPPVDQQAKDSLIQRIRSDPDGQEQVSRPATKNDYVMHEVKVSDTLERICIQYDVNKDAIKMANGFTGEEVYMFKVLKVPFTYGEVYKVPPEKDREEEKKRWAKEQMHQVVRDVNRNNGNYEAEVKFYLELYEYDMEKAMKAYEEDMRFEKQVMEENKRFRREKKRQRFADIG